jgi:uncharacterized protein (TIGR02246 family)
MRKSIAFLLLAAAPLALTAGCARQPAAPPVDTAAITGALDSLNQALHVAVAARDTDAVVSMYTDDARFLPAGMPLVEGREGIRAAWVGFLSTPGLDLSATSGNPIITEAGDMVIDVGGYSMKFTGPKGEAMEDVGKYVTVYRKVDGQWKIVVDIFNSDKAPGGA